MVAGPLAGRTLTLCFCWICSILSYYALLLNVGDLSGDIFANFALSHAADIPANLSLFFIIDRYGESDRLERILQYVRA